MLKRLEDGLARRAGLAAESTARALLRLGLPLLLVWAALWSAGMAQGDELLADTQTTTQAQRIRALLEEHLASRGPDAGAEVCTLRPGGQYDALAPCELADELSADDDSPIEDPQVTVCPHCAAPLLSRTWRSDSPEQFIEAYHCGALYLRVTEVGDDEPRRLLACLRPATSTPPLTADASEEETHER